ncbi:hypothetical protein ColKHC_05054 [Colletotrichum higginsianum]|nr:hypothetical protein ColKHC_05054 [Colletotrichum higginsianum]
MSESSTSKQTYYRHWHRDSVLSMQPIAHQPQLAGIFRYLLRAVATWRLIQVYLHLPPPTFRQPLPKLAEQYFAFSTDHDQSSFVFQRSSPLPRIEKRQRAESDVDGPYTAALSCKKRRLRLQLITSRLSQPFSLPATHIINREAIASGDKRFVKLAAVANSPDADRQGLIRETSIMLRAAVLNRVRLRVRNEAMLRGDLVVAVTAANAAVLHHGQQLATGPGLSHSPLRLQNSSNKRLRQGWF